MKKVFAFALCLAAVASAGAQKTLADQAKKLSSSDMNQARELVKQAITADANDPYNYFVAGSIEWDAFDKSNKALLFNPNDTKIDKSEMGKQLVNGYNYFIQVLPLDQKPNEKGQIKPKYTSKIIGKVVEHYIANDFFNAGAQAYQDKQYYPLAYEAFMIQGKVPGMPEFSDKLKNVPDSVRAQSFFNAGLSAWAGNNLQGVAEAMKNARLLDYKEPEAYIYEIAAWQRMAQEDSTQQFQKASEKAIQEVAEAGYKKFGLEQPLFINNLINSMIGANQNAEALAKLNELISENPQSPDLYSLRAFVYDRQGKDEESVADYKKAASMQGASFDILKVAANKLLRMGTNKINDTDRSDKAAMEALKMNYFMPAQDMLKKAIEVKGGESDSDIDYLMENVTYALENYF